MALDPPNFRPISTPHSRKPSGISDAGTGTGSRPTPHPDARRSSSSAAAAWAGASRPPPTPPGSTCGSPRPPTPRGRARRDAALLCVPDDAIAEACEAVAGADPPPPCVGHVSGATTLDALGAGRARARDFSLHPLQTFADGETAVDGYPCAIAGSDEAAAPTSPRALADALGMRPFEVPEESRAAYHAAARSPPTS